MNANNIAAEIRRGIAAGEYRYGTRLPSVRALADLKGVSQQTVAAAYAALSALGLVRTERGSGTTVTAAPAAEAHLGTFSPPDLTAATPWRASQGTSTEETTLVRQIPASESPWGFSSGDVVERTRMHYVDGAPVQHKITVLPYDLAARTPEGYSGVPPMLAPVGAPTARPPHGVSMMTWLGWEVAGTSCVITADEMTPEACAALRMPSGSPGFQIVNTARDADGRTMYVTVTSTPLHHKVTLDITHATTTV